MKIKELAEVLGAEIICGDSNRIITGGYAGDFLSHVLVHAPENSAWFTVIGDINVAAVAVKRGIGAVVICDGVAPDEALIKRAEKENLPLLTTDKDVYAAVRAVPDNIL